MESGTSSGDTASASQRAEELRASLGTRRDVEAVLAEAIAARQAAAADADALVAEAQQLSEQLLAESNAEAERITASARERAEELLTRARTDAEDVTRQARAAADAVRARAEAEVEEHRRRVRAEVIEQVTREVTEANRTELATLRQQSGQMIGDLEASVRILGVSLEAALANTGEMLSALEGLRAHTVENLGHRDPRSGGAPGAAVPAGPPVFRVPTEEDVAAPVPVDDAVDDAVDGEVPMTATEVFLRSNHLEHGDPPLPPLDDTEVGNRYARDAARRGRTRPERQADRETLDVVPRGEGGRDRESPDDSEREPDTDSAGRPLGWLFRSSP